MKQEKNNKTAARSNGKSQDTGKTKSGLQSGQQSGSSQPSAETMDHPESYLEKFLTDQLKDIYYAEKRISEGLKIMQQAATTDELKDAFLEHGMQTHKHIRRLEKVFGLLHKNPEGKKCEAIEGILKETETIIGETQAGTMTRDAALIYAAQKVEHYEIATYGGLVQFAITMGLYEAADILDRTLREEEDTDRLLTEIAENDINLDAEQEGMNFSWAKEDQASVSS